MSEKKSNIFIGIAAIAVVVFIGFFASLLSDFHEASVINFGEFSVAIGTLLLAAFTFQLAVTEVEESQNERKRLRLKEQLEGFYSLLMPYIDDFNDQRTRGVFLHEKQGLMNNVQSKYEFLASPKLRELFRRFYDRNDCNKNWAEIINSIHDTILEDFHKFTEEYNKLTE